MTVPWSSIHYPITRKGGPSDLAPPGLTIRWIIAKITSEGLTNRGTRYANYLTGVVASNINGATAIQPSTDSGGVVTDLGNGRYSYQVSTALPDVDPTLTHVAGGQVAVRDPIPAGPSELHQVPHRGRRRGACPLTAKRLETFFAAVRAPPGGPLSLFVQS